MSDRLEGVARTMACERCSSTLPDGARFCPMCGAATGTGAVADARRLVTVLFVDVVGSTELAERLDPEAFSALMTAFYNEVRSAVESHGGLVQKYIGDAVMAVFGIPAAREDDAFRAVRCALDLHDNLARVGTDDGITLSVRVGVNTGEVVVGDAAAGGSIVLGDAVNVAARLQAAAEPGGVLVGPTTATLLGTGAVLESRGALELRGRRDPVPTWRVRQLAAPVPAADLPLTGRAVELQQLTGAMETVRQQGVRALVTVLGEPGVGKSRLGRQLATESTGVRVLMVRCTRDTGSAAIAPLRQMVASVASLDEVHAPEAIIATLSAVLGGGRSARVMAARLAAGLRFVDAPATSEEVRWAVRRFVEAVAARLPVLLVVEDAQWASPLVLDVVDDLLTPTAPGGVLAVCLARPEFATEQARRWQGHASVSSIALNELEQRDAATLVDRAAGARVAPAAQASILRVAGGNPLYIEELVQSLLASNGFRDDNGLLTLDAGVTESLPPTLRQLLTARLDSLSPVERRTLERASIVGESFTIPEVACLGEEDVTEVASVLAAAEALGFVRRAGAGLAFHHVLLRDAAYDSVLKTRRAHLHRRLAVWMDGLGEEYSPERIGFHYERAYGYRRAVHSHDPGLTELGRVAGARLGMAAIAEMGRGDGRSAEDLLRRSTDLLPDDDPLRHSQELLRVRALHTVDAAAARRLLAGVVRRQQRDPVAAAIADVEALAANLEAQEPAPFAERQAVVDRAISALAAAGDNAGLARAYHVRAQSAVYHLRLAEAPESAELSARYARAAGDRSVEINAVSQLFNALSWGPVPVPEATARIRAAMDEHPGAIRLQYTGRLHLALLAAMLGDREAALRHLADAARLGADLPSRVDRWLGHGYASNTLLTLGDHQASLARADEAWADSIGLGHNRRIVISALARARALWATGRRDDAAAVATDVLARVPGCRDHRLYLSMASLAHAHRGEQELARTTAERAAHRPEGDTALEDHAEMLRMASEAMDLAGDRHRARVMARATVAAFRRKGNVAREAEARAWLESLSG